MAAKQPAKVRGVYEYPKGSGVWCINYFDRGRRHRESIGPRALAIKVLEKRRTEIREGRYFPNLHRRAVLFDDLLSDYREWAASEGKSIIKGQGCFGRLLDAFGGRRVDGITLADVEYFKHQLGEELKVGTVNRNLALARAVFNRGVRHGRIQASPMSGLKFDLENNTRRRFLEPEEEMRLTPELPERLRPWVSVALHTGMRLGELLALRWADVDFGNGTILVREAKAGEGRIAWASPEGLKTLSALRREQIRKGMAGGDLTAIRERYVFQDARGSARTNLWRYWHVALERAGVKDFRFHDLRHTFASRLVNEGVDLYTVKELLGHKTFRMTERYAHVADNHKREAVARLAR